MQVTGTFADVLNWGTQEGETFGVTMRESTEANKGWNDAVAECQTAEDYFNLALQNCQTEAERADLVMQAMAKQGLRESADAWKENNKDIINTNESQSEFEEAQARLGEKLSPVKDAITDLGTAGFNFLADAVDTVSGAIDDLIDWWDDLMGKIQKGWNDFWGIEEGSRDMSRRGTGFVDGSHAKGLDYVPWDGYIAQLHKGEMVLPKKAADAIRDASGQIAGASYSLNFARGPSAERTGSVVEESLGAAAIAAAVQSALDGAAVYLNGRKVGNLITQQQNQTAIARGQSPVYI